MTSSLFTPNIFTASSLMANNQIAKEHKDTNLKLEFTHSKEGIFVEADKGRINQVISNLLSNAIKFTDKQYQMTMRLL